MEEAYRAALACLAGMSSLAFPRLLQLAGGARELWEILKAGGSRAAALVGAEKTAAWADACRRVEPAELLKNLTRRGIRVITHIPRISGGFSPN